MGVILVYDWDFFHYPNVMPNLECMKYCAYFKKKKQIVVFKPEFEPQKYTQAFFRKDYDDGIYDKSILQENVIYGGRAFSNEYQPLKLEIEDIEPDIEIYKQYADFYTLQYSDKNDFRTLLNATHIRASLDGKDLRNFPFNRLQPAHPTVIFHDYDLGKIPSILDLAEELNNLGKRPYRIGNKFPINVYNYQDLKKWLKISVMGNGFCVQFNGILTDEEIIDLVKYPNFKLHQVLYNFIYQCSSESDFIQNRLSILYKQLLYLRRNNKEILLNIDTSFFQTKPILDLIILLNSFYKNKTWPQVCLRDRTLYGYCSSQSLIKSFLRNRVFYSVSKEEMRASFQYVRKHNYEVFCMFYDIPGIIAKGGKLVNER